MKNIISSALLLISINSFATDVITEKLHEENQLLQRRIYTNWEVLSCCRQLKSVNL